MYLLTSELNENYHCSKSLLISQLAGQEIHLVLLYTEFEFNKSDFKQPNQCGTSQMRNDVTTNMNMNPPQTTLDHKMKP